MIFLLISTVLSPWSSEFPTWELGGSSSLKINLNIIFLEPSIDFDNLALSEGSNTSF